MPNDYWTAETVEDYMRCKVNKKLKTNQKPATQPTVLNISVGIRIRNT